MLLDKEVGDFSFQITDKHFLCPKSKEELDDIVIYMNHSCNPNIGMDGQITNVAMRDIKANEELCLDYAMAMDTDYKLKCMCGVKNCRRIITGRDWQNKELQKKYNGYFASFINKKIISDQPER